MKKKGILIVSYGTGKKEARERSLDRIMSDIRGVFPEVPVYEAWTGEGLIEKAKRAGSEACTLAQAMMCMQNDGVTELYVQPTHVVDGEENQKMVRLIGKYSSAFSSVVIGESLLKKEADLEQVIGAIMSEHADLQENEALLFMGHGSDCSTDSIYGSMDMAFKKQGYSNVFLRTMKENERLSRLAEELKDRKVRRIYLAPFMITAGKHAEKEMAGEQSDSWKKRLETAGFQVECVLKGLGEYEKVREIFVMRINENIRGQQAENII